MPDNAGTLNPSRGNRRFIILAVLLGLMGAALVYMAASRDSSAPVGAVTPTTPVIVASVDIPARTAITASMLDVRLLPTDSVGVMAYKDVSEVVGQVTRFPLVAGEQVLPSKVVTVKTPGGVGLSRSLSFVIPEGMRAFAITATEVQNAGGLLLPGDYVDIIVIHDVQFLNDPADPKSREVVPSYLVQTLMQNIEVLAVSQAVVDVVEARGAGNVEGGDDAAFGSQRVRNSEAAAQPDAVTVTLALTVDEAQRLYLAESNGRIRLAVRPYGEDTTQPVDYQTKLELIPLDIANPFEALR